MLAGQVNDLDGFFQADFRKSKMALFRSSSLLKENSFDS